jgi:hypothetical protein
MRTNLEQAKVLSELGIVDTQRRVGFLQYISSDAHHNADAEAKALAWFKACLLKKEYQQAPFMVCALTRNIDDGASPPITDRMYCFFTGVEIDPAVAVREYKTLLALDGSAETQRKIGRIYLYGYYGIQADEDEGLYWLKKAAEQGDADAQHTMGNQYQWCTDAPGHKTEAIKWYTKAAEQGHAKAQFRLGDIYANGRPTYTDATTAVYWYKKATKARGKACSETRQWARKRIKFLQDNGYLNAPNATLNTPQETPL